MNIGYQDAAQKGLPELYTAYSSSKEGLSEDAAAQRLRNAPKEHKKVVPMWLPILFRQFRSAFVYLLIGAAGISVFLGEYVDASLILLFLLLNTALGFFQEFRAERALGSLNTLLVRKTTVRRSGKLIQIITPEVVPGDVVVLSAGDMIPADGRFIHAEHVLVDESPLTGESAPVSKHAESLREVPKGYDEAENIGFARTTLVEGDAELLVTSVGKNTAVGEVVSEIDNTRRGSAFEEGMNKLSLSILRMVVMMIPILFVLNLIVHKNDFHIPEFLVFVIALTISAIPEALPLVTTLALSRGALALSKKSVIPRRLSAVEDLGSVQVLCTDKTGTITENRLTIKAIYGEEDQVIEALLWDPHTTEAEAQLNVFDRAILDKGQHHTMSSTVLRIDELPFDPDRRRESVLFEDHDKAFLVVRGGPEYIKARGIDDRALEWAKEKGKEGCRILAVGIKEVPVGQKDISVELEEGARFVGMAAFFDPLKPSTKKAVVHAEELGVRVKIITGDSREVAGWVGYEAGIIDRPEKVLTGQEFLALSEGERRKAVLEYDVFARTAPIEKKEILSYLKEQFIVGFLGEGFNDAPALKLAHVGLVVENASDIARDTADVVLMNKSLDVIVDGVREGRVIFANTMKYIRATLTSNFGNFYALAFSTLFVPYLPMLPIQILLLNLLSDFPMITIATDTVDTEEVRKPKQYELRELMRLALLLGIISTAFDFLFFFVYRGYGESTLQTFWFMGSILTELILLFSIRTMRPFWKASRPHMFVTGFTGAVALVTVLLPFTTFGQKIFHFVLPDLHLFCLMIGIVLCYFLATEAGKLLILRLTPSSRQ
jgi:Mg2+-importing ATPase